MKLIAVIICNYNKKDFVLSCIDSVFASEFNDYDLIVVDNASTDGSVDAIQERFCDRIKLIINKENTGGSGGFNRGMTYAMGCGYKYIYLLDNDVIVEKNAIGALYNFMESHNEAGACGSLIFRANEENIIQEYGANINLKEYDMELLYKNQPYNSNFPIEIMCDYVAACSSMFRSSVLKQVGVIDAEYFVYWDDIALSWKIRNAGYKIYATSESKVWHYGTWRTRPAFARYYNFRNKFLIFTRYLDDENFELFMEAMILRTFRMLAVNHHENEINFVYMHALNDALNGRFGKADAYKISVIPSKCEVQREIEIIEVPHVLDVGTYDREKIYVDPYLNVLYGDADFDFVENIEEHYSFFRHTYGGFIKSQLMKLREDLRNG